MHLALCLLEELEKMFFVITITFLTSRPLSLPFLADAIVLTHTHAQTHTWSRTHTPTHTKANTYTCVKGPYTHTNSHTRT